MATLTKVNDIACFGFWAAGMQEAVFIHDRSVCWLVAASGIMELWKVISSILVLNEGETSVHVLEIDLPESIWFKRDTSDEWDMGHLTYSREVYRDR